MDPNQEVEPLSYAQLEKIDALLSQHGDTIATTNKHLYTILTALCDPTHKNGTLQMVEKAVDKTQPRWKENVLHVSTPEDGWKSAWQTLTQEYKGELTVLLKNYKALVKSHKPNARTLAAFKEQLRVHDEGENADFYTIVLGEGITKQFEIRGKNKDKIFFAGENDFLVFFHDIRGKKIPIDIKAVRDELASSMRIIKEKTKKGYTIRFLIDSSKENWELQCTVTRDKQIYQRTYQLSFADLKKIIDGLIGKETNYANMFTPVKKKGSSSSLLNQEEEEEEDEEEEDD